MSQIRSPMLLVWLLLVPGLGIRDETLDGGRKEEAGSLAEEKEKEEEQVLVKKREEDDCDGATEDEMGFDYMVALIEKSKCDRCYNDFMMDEQVKTEKSCTQGDLRSKLCYFKDGECKRNQEKVPEKQETCQDIEWADAPPIGSCTDVAPLGCVSDLVRPWHIEYEARQQEKDGKAVPKVLDVKKTFLSNVNDAICFFNSAVIALFAGSNDLVKFLVEKEKVPAGSNECFPTVRNALTRVLRAMRNKYNTVNEDVYIRPMMQCVRANCRDEHDGMTTANAVAKFGGEEAGVLMHVLLPALAPLTWKVENVDYGDCQGKGSLTKCLADKMPKDDPDLLLFSFNIYSKKNWEASFKIFEAGAKLSAGGEGRAKYSLWSGTSAQVNHNVAWTVHPIKQGGAPRLTVYNDLKGITEYQDVEEGFKTMRAPDNLDLRIKIIIFKKDGL